MSLTLGQAETNRQIFDSFVISMLNDCGAQQVDQPAEDLLDSVENGQASIDAALNLIVIAHATWLFSEVCAPIDEPAWTNDLTVLRSRMASALPKCRDILGSGHLDYSKPTDEPSSSWNHFWHVVVPLEYGMEPWEEFKGSRLLTSTKVAECPFLGDLRLMGPWPPDSPRRLSFERELVEYSDITTLTSWHYFAMSDRISDLMDKLETLEFDDWATAVDVCSLLMSRAAPLGEDLEIITEQPWSFTSSEIRASPTSAEHWAWQFGRVTALWPMGENVSAITPDEYFNTLMSDWANGLTALSLLCTAKEPLDALLAACWDGITFTSYKRIIEDAVELTPTNHLFWLMRLGFLDGIKRVEEHKKCASTHSPEVEASNMLMVGLPEELGKAIVTAQQEAERDHENQIENNIADRLGKIWDRIPPDSKQQLIEAELNIKRHKAVPASQNYANAVEGVLKEWLSDPGGRSDWPRGINGWEDCIRKMTRFNKGKRHKLDDILRKRFDPRYAAELAKALDVFREGRKPGAHGEPLPPFALKAKETALGSEHNPSVFELLLKFARRWR